MRGLSIVKAFMAEHGTDRRIFRRSRSSLRNDLVRRLYSAGITQAEISRLIDVDATTVSYWLSDEVRAEKKRSAMRASYHKRKVYRWWDECAKAMEARL
jgi:predicted transcriptional regulator